MIKGKYFVNLTRKMSSYIAQFKKNSGIYFVFSGAESTMFWLDLLLAVDHRPKYLVH